MAPIRNIERRAYCDECPADPMIKGGSERSQCPLASLDGYTDDVQLDSSPEIKGGQAERFGDNVFCTVGYPHVGALKIKR